MRGSIRESEFGREESLTGHVSTDGPLRRHRWRILLQPQPYHKGRHGLLQGRQKESLSIREKPQCGTRRPLHLQSTDSLPQKPSAFKREEEGETWDDSRAKRSAPPI